MSSAAPSVLILHQMGNPQLVPGFLPKHLRSFADTYPECPCLFHDVSLPLPQSVQRLPFDAVFLDVTMLRTRWQGNRARESIESTCAFLTDSPAIKFAFPQDEYDCSAILDEWMCRWKVDVVHSVIDGYHDILYPQYHRQGRIELGFTGYIDEKLVDREWTRWPDRAIDVGYRAKQLPPYFGRIGELKSSVALDFLAHAAGRGLRTDIAIGDRHAIKGDGWMKFVESCRFMIGTPSGSSLLDPHGEIQSSVRRYMRAHPSAPFEEVERMCFAGKDGLQEFTAISPRILEAALAGTGQLLVEGSYSGLLRAGEHFIELASDASNIAEVIDAMNDHTQVARTIRNCRSALLDHGQLRYRARDKKLLSQILAHSPHAVTPEQSTTMRAAISEYEIASRGLYRQLWKAQANRARLSRFLDSTPAPLSRLIRCGLAAIRGKS